MSVGGVLRYVGPTSVFPVITALDACDVQPTFEDVLHNGEAYQLGTPISATGLHVIQVTAKDDSDNVTDAQIVFEIQPRPSKQAVAVVEATESVLDAEGRVTSISGTVLLSSAEFDHRDILLSSVKLMLRDSDNRWMNAQPISIKDAFLPGSRVFQHETAAAEGNDCLWRVSFAADFDEPLLEAPASFDLMGVGLVNGAIGFEWGASVPNVVDPTPTQTLAAAIGADPELCQVTPPDPDPDPEPPVPCEAISSILLDPLTPCLDTVGAGESFGSSTCAPSTRATSNALADGLAKVVQGSSDSRATADTNNPTGNGYCTIASNCADDATATFVVMFIGNCCDCSITFNFSATVSARAQVESLQGNIDGSVASATGSIGFITQCGIYTAAAGADASADDLAAPGDSVTNTDSETISESCTVNTCSGDVVDIDLSVNVGTSVWANNPPARSEGRASARINGFATLNWNTTFTECPPPELDHEHEDP